MAASDDNLKIVSPRQVARISLSNVEDMDLAQLLEDTAKLIRSDPSKFSKTTPRNEKGYELAFSRVDLEDFVIVSHRS